MLVRVFIIFFTGAGIFVFVGTPPTGAQPNNGLVVSTNPGNGLRFRFFCRSDSVTFNVGQLIGLDGNNVSNSDFFGFGTPGDGGELRVENTVGMQTAVTSSQQGVYTCRIPLQNGEIRDINIGVYPDQFDSEFLFV